MIRDDRMEKFKQTIIRVVCAWCGADLGTINGQGQTGISHGICEECANKMVKEE